MLPLFAFFWITWMTLSVYHVLSLLKYFQLEEYNTIRFIKLSFSKWKISFRYCEIIAIFIAVISLFLFYDIAVIITAIFTLLSLASSYLIISKHKQIEVTKLVYTTRAKRLIFVSVVIYVLLSLFVLRFIMPSLILLAPEEIINEKIVFGVSTFLFIGQFSALNIILANILLFPYEEIMRKYYVSSARKVLNRVTPTVIGITGSYGKTSTKEILAHIISTRFDVLKTPKSYNTLLGICKVIREELNPHHQYFVVEMGAYRPGEIKSICELVLPTYGVLTAIGPQHLERFKEIENVVKAKNELIESLPASGLAIFNADDQNCMILSNKTNVKVMRYGISNQQSSDVFADDISITAKGTEFQLVIKNTNDHYKVQTALLGHHNVLNIMAAILIAQEIGITYKQAIAAISTIHPTPHRLEAVRSNNGITYIDDSYNANPVGAKIALDVLKAFSTTGRKILVTPGYAELGNLQAIEHENLGYNAGNICDTIVLIGNKLRTSQIRKGILKSSFDMNKIYCFISLNDAKEFLGQFVLPGDIVLFENDLSDNYQ
jgi:UDP-N-acetylmuramoyl-tripeptide--D-alanyl-D-alanine ligase